MVACEQSTSCCVLPTARNFQGFNYQQRDYAFNRHDDGWDYFFKNNSIHNANQAEIKWEQTIIPLITSSHMDQKFMPTYLHSAGAYLETPHAQIIQPSISSLGIKRKENVVSGQQKDDQYISDRGAFADYYYLLFLITLILVCIHSSPKGTPLQC